MTERDLESLLLHLRKKLSKFVGRDVAWQMEVHGKGSSVQIRVTEIANLECGNVTLEERR